VIDLTGSCRRHRAALVDFVDRGELGDSAEAAFTHLERCRRCVSELESIALTITALRRLGDAMARQEPRPDAWPRLRARLARGRRPLVMSPIAGMALGMAVVAAIVGPYEIRSGPLGPVLDEANQQADPWVAEQRFVTAGRNGPLAERVTIRLDGATRNYPDGIQPRQKEVTTERVSGRPVTPS
jgi:anti-sigma factor RsiW